MSTAELLDAYQASRDPGTDTRVLCHAPFVSLNFEQNGQVTTCCYNRSFVLGVYPEQSLREIWEGVPARELREAFLRDEEARGCDLCFHQLEIRNFEGALMRNFDRFSHGDAEYRPRSDPPAPRVLEFEIANTCNLECVMCGGHWSSAIRAHREKLPPLVSPYDDAFVEQLDDYLPGIASARFLGGEPFLIKRYYAIWERIRTANPGAELVVTTNGTLLPARARALLEDLYFHVVVSLDSLDAATFESIRLGARFDAVMQNLATLIDYTRRRGTNLTLSVCPMLANWRGLPELLAFCEREELGLHFNLVLRPAHVSLASLPSEEIARVADFLAKFQPGGQARWTRQNRAAWDGLVNQLRSWCEHKQQFERECRGMEKRFRSFAAGHPQALQGWSAVDGFGRLAASATRSLGIARAREGCSHLDLRTLLPPVPIELAADGGTPSADDLLLATHLLFHFEEAERMPGDARDDARLATEQSSLRGYLARRHAEDPAWVDNLAAWLRSKLEQGEASDLVRWMGHLLPALDAADPERVLGWGLAWLRERGLDPPAEREVTVFFAAFLARFIVHESGVPWLTLESAGPFPRVDDLDDLRRVLDALHLLHRAHEASADHAAFRRRLDRCLDAVAASGKVELACRSLRGANATGMYAMLAHASDEELERALRFLS